VCTDQQCLKAGATTAAAAAAHNLRLQNSYKKAFQDDAGGLGVANPAELKGRLGGLLASWLLFYLFLSYIG
jgi:hypothetical protein